MHSVVGKGTINATVNGAPTTVNVGGIGPLVTTGIPALLLLLSAICYVLYVKMCSFMFDAEKITVTSGVLFPSTKTVLFKSFQNVETKRGPLLMMFGLQNV